MEMSRAEKRAADEHEHIREYVEKVVATAPPLTNAQRERLADLLAPRDIAPIEVGPESVSETSALREILEGDDERP